MKTTIAERSDDGDVLGWILLPDLEYQRLWKAAGWRTRASYSLSLR